MKNIGKWNGVNEDERIKVSIMVVVGEGNGTQVHVAAQRRCYCSGMLTTTQLRVGHFFI